MTNASTISLDFTLDTSDFLGSLTERGEVAAGVWVQVRGIPGAFAVCRRAVSSQGDRVLTQLICCPVIPTAALIHIPVRDQSLRGGARFAQFVTLSIYSRSFGRSSVDSCLGSSLPGCLSKRSKERGWHSLQICAATRMSRETKELCGPWVSGGADILYLGSQ